MGFMEELINTLFSHEKCGYLQIYDGKGWINITKKSKCKQDCKTCKKKIIKKNDR